jgi:hypothetical protein
VLALVPIGTVSLVLAFAVLLRNSGQNVLSGLLFFLAGLGVAIRFIHAAVTGKQHTTKNRVTFALVCATPVLALAGFLVFDTLREVGRPLANPTTSTTSSSQTAAPQRTSPPPVVSPDRIDQGKVGEAPSSAPPESQAELGRKSEPRTESVLDGVVTRPGLASPTPPVLGAPSSPADKCDASVPDREPKVRLEPGDIIVAGGGGLFRLDAALNETAIAFGGHVERARGIAVSRTGEIYVASVACRKGAVVRVDPLTGTQTVVASGFRTTVGIAVDRDGTVLVSDEHPVEGRWGQLFRFNFVTGRSSVEYSFGADSVPTSIDFDRKSGEMVVASKKIYLMTPDGPRLVGLDVTNVHALALRRPARCLWRNTTVGPWCSWIGPLEKS